MILNVTNICLSSFYSKKHHTFEEKKYLPYCIRTKPWKSMCKCAFSLLPIFRLASSCTDVACISNYPVSITAICAYPQMITLMPGHILADFRSCASWTKSISPSKSEWKFHLKISFMSFEFFNILVCLIRDLIILKLCTNRWS